MTERVNRADGGALLEVLAFQTFRSVPIASPAASRGRARFEAVDGARVAGGK